MLETRRRFIWLLSLRSVYTAWNSTPPFLGKYQKARQEHIYFVWLAAPHVLSYTWFVDFLGANYVVKLSVFMPDNINKFSPKMPPLYQTPMWTKINRRTYFLMFFGCGFTSLPPPTSKQPRNRSLGIDSDSLCSLAGRYDKYTVKKCSRVSRLQPGCHSPNSLGRNNSVMTSLFPPRESLVVTSRLGMSRTFFYGVGLSYRLVRLHRLEESIPWSRILDSLKVTNSSWDDISQYYKQISRGISTPPGACFCGFHRLFFV